MAAERAGTLLASLIIAFSKWVERNVWSVKYALIFWGGGMILMALLPGQWQLALIGIFLLMGWALGLVNIYLGAIMQRITAPEHLGKTWCRPALKWAMAAMMYM